mgnify:CR=1 FL=1
MLGTTGTFTGVARRLAEADWPAEPLESVILRRGSTRRFDVSRSLTFEELLKHLDGKIGKHEMPIALEIRPELPKTPVGKLSKKELKEEERAKAQAKAA